MPAGRISAERKGKEAQTHPGPAEYPQGRDIFHFLCKILFLLEVFSNGTVLTGLGPVGNRVKSVPGRPQLFNDLRHGIPCALVPVGVVHQDHRLLAFSTTLLRICSTVNTFADASPEDTFQSLYTYPRR